MIAQAGKAAFLKERGDAIAVFLKAGVAVCLVDVRGTGETKPGDGSPGRSGSRTSISQTNLILGQPLLGSQLRDLRTVIRWLQGRKDIDGRQVIVWGDSFAPTNPKDFNPAIPLDAPDLPRYAEPGAALLARLAVRYPDGVKLYYASGGLLHEADVLTSPYLYVPHDAIVPGASTLMVLGQFQGMVGIVDLENRPKVGHPVAPEADAARELVKRLGPR
jgi:hypothetical protein